MSLVFFLFSADGGDPVLLPPVGLEEPGGGVERGQGHQTRVGEGGGVKEAEGERGQD